MKILGIETSCDETGLAIYDTDAGLLSETLHSQVELHAEYGGVVPELASRDHIRKITPATEQVLADESLQELWMRQIQQDPSVFLSIKFQMQLEKEAPGATE